MTRAELLYKLTLIFREIFEDDNIIINDNTKAEDIENWDSFRHISLLSAIEDEFQIKFRMKEIAEMKNVGEITDHIIASLDRQRRSI